VTDNPSAQHSALHAPGSGNGPYAQVARTRARNTGPAAAATPEPVTASVRSALDVARQRWGSAPARREDDGTVLAGVPAAPPAGHPAPFSSWGSESRPVREVWATYRADAARAADRNPFLGLGYWLLALPAFTLHALLRLGQDSTTSLPRTLAFAVALTVLIAGLILLH
jgi:hypothetical protein